MRWVVGLDGWGGIGWGVAKWVLVRSGGGGMGSHGVGGVTWGW